MPENFSRRKFVKGVGLCSIGGLAANAQAATAERYVIGTKSPKARRAAKREAASVVQEIEFARHGTAVVGYYPDAACESLAQLPGVKYVEKDAKATADETAPWSVERVGSLAAHDYGYTGGDVDVAILDTGIDPDHPDLAGNLGEGYAVVPCEADCSEPWGDDGGHGTPVAGIVGALDDSDGTIGNAPDVTLHAVKVMDSTGTAWDSDVAEGLRWTAEQGYDVANMSLSGGGSSVLKEAVQDAYARGVLLVGSAGNNSCSDCVGKPAKYSEVIAVSATDSDDQLAGYSSTGPEIEFAGTGHGTYTTSSGGGYETFYGTSSAAPHVAGVAALVMSQGYGNEEARRRLQETAEDIGLSSDEQGYGVPHAGDALDVEASVSVETEGSSDVGSDGVTLRGTVDELLAADSAQVAFQNRPASSGTWSRTDGETKSSTGSYSQSVSGLQSDTEYEFRAIAWTDDDSATGKTMTYRTTEGADSSTEEGDDGGEDDGCDGICLFGIDVIDFTFDITWVVADFLIDFTFDQFWVVGMVMDMSGNVIDSASTSSSSGTLDGEMTFDIPDEYDEVQVTLEVGTDEDGVLDAETRTVEL